MVKLPPNIRRFVPWSVNRRPVITNEGIVTSVAHSTELTPVLQAIAPPVNFPAKLKEPTFKPISDDVTLTSPPEIAISPTSKQHSMPSSKAMPGDLTRVFKQDWNCTVPVAPDGDLHLIVGRESGMKTFQVSTQVMLLVSSYWRSMLLGGFKVSIPCSLKIRDARKGLIDGGDLQESQPDTKAIELDDDKPEICFIVLLVAHLRFQEIPTEMGIKQLAELFFYCDKTDCIEKIAPWIPGWIAPWRTPELSSDLYDWAVIAWTTGDEALLVKAVRKIVQTCCTNTEGHVLSSSNEDTAELLLPKLSGL